MVMEKRENTNKNLYTSILSEPCEKITSFLHSCKNIRLSTVLFSLAKGNQEYVILRDHP